MKNKSACVFLAICLILVITRLLVPAHIDWSITSFQKDFAHLVWSPLMCWTLFPIKPPNPNKRGILNWFSRRRWQLFLVAWAVAFFELWAALAGVGGF